MMQTIAILGDNACAWMAAAALARQVPREGFEVIVVDDGRHGDGLGDFGPALAVPPTLGNFHAGIGVDEDVLIAAGGSYTLGTAFTGWRGDGSTVFLPFGEIGASMGSVAFPQLAARMRAQGQTVRLADHSIAALAAQANRFSRAPRGSAAPLSGLAHGLHVEAASYARVLRRAAMANGARFAAAPFRTARRDADGVVTALVLADDTQVVPLIVLDCSGAMPLLADGVFEEWRALLPCDRVGGAVIAADDSPPPYAHIEATEAGWIATLPLSGADARIVITTDGEGRGFSNGRRVDPWRGNCIALGAAACVLEPLHPTALTLVRNALARLIALFPADSRAPVEAREFNRVAANEQLRARDFILGQYAASGRSGTFWDGRRSAMLPEPLAAKRALFAARGRVPMFDDEIFEEEDWGAMFDAAGLTARRHDALADQLAPDTIRQHIADHRARLIEAVRGMPTHADALSAARRRAAA